MAFNSTEYNRKRYRQRRQWALVYLGGKCAYCGSTDDLEVDHIDPNNKSMVLAHMARVTQVCFVAELNKCQLLCHSCHVEKSRHDGSTMKNAACGESVNHAKFTASDIVTIRDAVHDGATQQQVALRYGVTRGCIGQIVRKETWKHVS